MSIYLEMTQAEDVNIRVFLDTGESFVPPHWHKQVEVLYVKKGIIHVTVNDQPLILREGDILIINGGDIHQYSASPKTERLILIFDPALFQDLSSLTKRRQNLKAQIAKIEPLSHQWNSELVEHISNLLDRLYKEYQEKDEGYDYVVNAKMFELLAIIYRELPQKEQQVVPSKQLTYTDKDDILEKLNDIFTYIELQYKNPITLEDVAEHIGFSPFYLTKFFKKNTGTTVVTFLNHYRISKAKWLLANEKLPITEIAYEAGFQSLKTFYRLFKNEVGMSPLQYQKKQMELLQKIL